MENSSYDKYITIEADPELLDELHEALEYIWQKDSALITEAAAHNNGPITIKYSKDIEETDISDLERNIIPISSTAKDQHYVTEAGEWHPMSLTRVIAHELTHTMQPKLTAEQKQENFNLRFNLSISGAVRDNNLAHAKFFLDLLEDHDLLDGTTSENLSENLQELYKKDHVKESWGNYLQDMIDGYEELYTTGYASFVTEVEKPAIERANNIMEGKEPPRSLDYKEGIHSYTSLSSKLDILLTEEKFLDFGERGLRLTVNDNLGRFANQQGDTSDIRTFSDLIRVTSKINDDFQQSIESPDAEGVGTDVPTFLIDNPHYQKAVTGLKCDLER